MRAFVKRCILVSSAPFRCAPYRAGAARLRGSITRETRVGKWHVFQFDPPTNSMCRIRFSSIRVRRHTKNEDFESERRRSAEIAMTTFDFRSALATHGERERIEEEV